MALYLLAVASGLFLFLHLRLAGRLSAAERAIEEMRLGAVRAGSTAASTPPPAEADEPQTFGGLFEQLVGGRMLIWIGGAALAVAGFFLIRYSIEVGLVTPAMRMVGAASFGLLLLGFAEVARGGRMLKGDPRIAQTLAGAGIAILYAAAYGSWYLFQLIDGTVASGLMLLITVGALGLSTRHGAPTAAMGLVGGFLTPALIGDPEGGALPILAYLTLLNAAIFFLAWRRGWTWLAAGAVALSFAWTGFLIFGPEQDALAAGIFALALAAIASFARPGEGRALLLLQPVVIGLVQLALLVARPDIDLPAWLLFGALALAALVLALWRAEFRFAPPAALLLALLLLLWKAIGPDDPLLATAAVTTTLLFAGLSAWPGAAPTALRTVTACAALAGPLTILRVVRPELAAPAAWGLMALILALAAVALLRLHRSAREQALPASALAPAAATTALLFALAGQDLTPQDFSSAGWLIFALALLLGGVKLPDKALRLAGLLLLTATVVKVFAFDAAALQGLLRILSFVGLGVALIGVGTLYGTVLRGERRGAGARKGGAAAAAAGQTVAAAAGETLLGG